MFNREPVLVRQVYEMHRLHGIQTALTEDFKYRTLDNNNSNKGGMHSASSVNLNEQAKFSMVDSIRSKDFNSWHEQHTAPAVHKHIDLQLSADEFIRHSVDYVTMTGGAVGSLKDSIELRSSLQGDVIYDQDTLDLSLSIGHNPNKMDAKHRSWMVNKFTPFSDVIDLEEPDFNGSDKYVHPGLASASGGSSMGFRNKGNLASRSQMDTRDIGRNSQRQALGFNLHHTGFSSADFWSKGQILGPCKANSLDLNKTQVEETLCISSNHSTLLDESRTSICNASENFISTCGVPFLNPSSRRKEYGEECPETSYGQTLKMMNSGLAISCVNDGVKPAKDYKLRKNNGGRISCIDHDSDSAEEPCCSISNRRIESLGSTSNLSSVFSCGIDLVDAVEAKAKVQRIIESPIFPQSCENKLAAEQLDCNKLHCQSSSIRTMQSGIKGGDVIRSFSDESRKGNASTSIAHAGEQDQRSSDSTESKFQYPDRREKEPKVDGLVRTAAESLVQISVETRASHQGDLTSLAVNDLRDIENNKQQCSSESYEAMVLNAKECGPDDYCVSSNAFEVDISEEKDIMYKLKRGTRFRDFQKDIFPGLSILSRHEVREDINLMEGVIRSKEYQKMRAKTADGHEWCRPTRSKRSRVSYSRRNYH